MERMRAALEGIREKEVVALIAFLGVPRTYEEIRGNASFCFLMTVFRLSEDQVHEKALDFEHVSKNALAGQAVRSWLSKLNFTQNPH